MEFNDQNTSGKYLRAKKRVEKLKGYYWHLTIFLVINISLSVYKIFLDMRGGDTFEEALIDYDNYSLWIWWGIGMFFHTYGVFGSRLLFMNKDWEDKKIREYMDEK